MHQNRYYHQHLHSVHEWLLRGFVNCLHIHVVFDPTSKISNAKNNYGLVVLNLYIGVWYPQTIVEDCSHKKVDRSTFDNSNKVRF